MSVWKTLVGVIVLCATVAALSDKETGAEYTLVPNGTATVAVDSTVHFGIYNVGVDGSLIQSAVPALTSVTWTVNGKAVGQVDPAAGSLRPSVNLAEATYRAPHQIPKTNPVAVAVRFKPSGSSAAELTLICNVTIRDQGNFLTLSGADVPDSRYELDDRYSTPQKRGLLARGMVLGPELQISVGPMSPATKTADLPAMTSALVTVLVAGKAAGDFKWSLPGATANSVTVLIGAAQYLSADCTPRGLNNLNNCQNTPTPGTTHVLSFDAATNTVRGTFEGKLVKMVGGRPGPYVTATGGFNATLQSIAGLPR